MESLKDYVTWIASSMGIDLEDHKADKLAKWLIGNKKYKEVVKELEEMIWQVKNL